MRQLIFALVVASVPCCAVGVVEATAASLSQTKEDIQQSRGGSLPPST